MNNFKKSGVAGSLSSISQVAQQSSVNNAGQIIYVHPDECYTDADNPRTQFDPLLVASYCADFLNPEEGQHEPCQVYPKDQKGYLIQHGATRLEAAKQALKVNPDFRLKVVVDRTLLEKTPLERYWQRGKNNIQRDNMSIIDRANFIGNYIDMAKQAGVPVSQQEIAEGLALKGGNTAVSRLLALRNASPEIKEIINTGRTEDIETLVTLVKIQESNPELFKDLIDNTDLDRATVRRAKKTGAVTVATPSVQNVSNVLAHAQNGSQIIDAGDDSVVTIAYMDYLFKTGQVNLLVKKSEAGFVGCIETVFDHGITPVKTFDQSPVFKSEDEAAEYAKTLLPEWAEAVTADKDAINIEEYQDAKGFLNWLSKKTDTVTQEKTNAAATRPRKASKGMKATIWGEVNGEQCELLVNVSQEVMGADMADKETSGFVWVSVNGVVKLASESDFVFKKVTYKE
ncbi:hypothetical protein NUM25_003841 [Salmonella enterica]|nr:hypothetical protein [Salmonella enterica]